jgi:membrane protease YdiL (CAAX protease family)
MTGTLKARNPLTQFLILISIAVASLFIIGLVGTLLVSLLTGISIDAIAHTDKWDPQNPATLTLIRGMQLVQFIALFVLPVYICSKLFSTDQQKYLGLNKPSSSTYYLIGAVLLVAAIPFSEYLGLLNRDIALPQSITNWMKSAEAEAERTIKILLAKHTVKDLLLNIIFVAGLAAVGEELLFRGMAQRLLIKMFKSPWAGIIVSAIIFSAIHMQFYGFLPRFMLGVLLGALYWYSGSLWVAILAHFVYDALLITIVYFNPGMEGKEEALPMQNIALMAAVSFAIVFLAVMWMRKKSAATYQAVYADDDIPVKNHPFDFE